MANLSAKLGSLQFTPRPQSPASAGFITDYSGTTAPQGYIALSSTTDTTISNAQSLYPDLWANSNSAWRSGSDLVVPAYNSGIYNSSPVQDTSYFSVGNFGSPSITSTWWYRENNFLKAMIAFTTTGSQGSQPYVQLPSGLNIDQTIALSSREYQGKYYRVISTASAEINGAGNEGVLWWDGTSHDRLYFGGYTASSLWQKNQPLATSDEMTVEINCPIAEWASQTSISIIKLYDDASNIAISLADATASLTGAVRLSSDFAATSSQYGLVLVPNGTVRLDTGDVTNPHGSTNTKIRNFTNSVDSGDAFTVVTSSATLGASITANRDMVASFSYSDHTAASGAYGISLNAGGSSDANGSGSSELTTSILSLTTSNRLIAAQTSGAEGPTCSVTIKLNSGDIIRPHTEGASMSSASKVQLIAQEIFRLGN